MSEIPDAIMPKGMQSLVKVAMERYRENNAVYEFHHTNQAAAWAEEVFGATIARILQLVGYFPELAEELKSTPAGDNKADRLSLKFPALGVRLEVEVGRSERLPKLKASVRDERPRTIGMVSKTLSRALVECSYEMDPERREAVVRWPLGVDPRPVFGERTADPNAIAGDVISLLVTHIGALKPQD